jgi:hypothetical protein
VNIFCKVIYPSGEPEASMPCVIMGQAYRIFANPMNILPMKAFGP